ncbi:MAG: hypothetical protein LPK45_09950, partial [Bacteroidota bacterium]|nr:hypothetical protein [Bacteroidota bacterium]MDX5431414.1 hypothetical protein [Bacteroidota bacterium]MDX5470142.1 hypothetical protein [Bacteroidota bacterium]
MLLSSSVFLSSYIQTIACYHGFDYEAYYTLIPMEKNSWDPYAPYYLSGYSVFGRVDDNNPDIPNNIDAWGNYFANKDIPAIQALIFDSDLESLQSLVDAIRQKKSLPDIWKDNSLAKGLQGQTKNPVLDYLLFAKKCEKHAMQNSQWWLDEVPADTLAMQALMLEGASLLKKCKDKSIKTRYHYQLLRLQFYMGQYEAVNAYYAKHFADGKWNNKLRFKAMSYDFGASYRVVS